MKKIVILILVFATLIGCSKDSDPENTNNVMIRLLNISQYDFENITVNTSTGNVNFENIRSGQKSEYKIFDVAYRYAYVQLHIDGVTYTYQPYDYFGEEPLENGNYTYLLNVNPQGQAGNVTSNLIRE